MIFLALLSLFTLCFLPLCYIAVMFFLFITLLLFFSFSSLHCNYFSSSSLHCNYFSFSFRLSRCHVTAFNIFIWIHFFILSVFCFYHLSYSLHFDYYFSLLSTNLNYILFHIDPVFCLSIFCLYFLYARSTLQYLFIYIPFRIKMCLTSTIYPILNTCLYQGLFSKLSPNLFHYFLQTFPFLSSSPEPKHPCLPILSNL